ncbi:MAG: hypothetical protein Kow0080_10840 [Candidatus Promineifilaceae bacterium]
MKSLKTIASILLVIFSGPAIGFTLATLGIALSPPWTFLSGLLYFPLFCLFAPLSSWAITKYKMGKIKGGALVITAVLAALFYAAYIGTMTPGIPTGITNCQPLPAEPPHVRYACVSSSSDDLHYTYSFTLEGREGWPFMRIKEAE